MDIRELRYIVELGKTRHINLAAQNLYISPPALHKVLHKIESELDAKLFYRRGRELIPTDIGEMVLTDAIILINSIDKIPEKVAEIKRLNYGKVVLGFPSIVGTIYLSDLLVRFREKYPQITLSTVEVSGEVLSLKVLSGELDLAITMRAEYLEHANGLSEVPLLNNQVAVAVPKNHPWASRSSIADQDFENVPFITFDSSFNMYSLLMKRFQNHNIVPQLYFTGASCHFLHNLAAKSGCPLVLPMPILEFYNQGTFEIIPFDPIFPWDLCLVFRKNTYLSTATKALLNHIQAYFL